MTVLNLLWRKGRPVTWIAAALLLTVAVHFAARPAPSIAQARRPTVVARIYYTNPADLARLTDVDLWEYNNVAEGYVLAAADGAALDRLRAAGWRVAVD
ncbi:MAG: hypothetical protein K1X50_19335, partial [Candidatus Promineofilum sp.]|nr:hypothetical protein [Promineifilum sp.]